MVGRMGNAWLGGGGLWSSICTLIIKCFLMSVVGLFNLEQLYTYARVCIVLNTEGGLLLGSENYPGKASLRDPEVSMSLCNTTQRIVCHIFLPLFPYCFLHLVISVFSSVQAWGIMADDGWTGHQWQHVHPISVVWVLLAEINGSTSSIRSCLDLLEK